MLEQRPVDWVPHLLPALLRGGRRHWNTTVNKVCDVYGCRPLRGVASCNISLGCCVSVARRPLRWQMSAAAILVMHERCTTAFEDTCSQLWGEGKLRGLSSGEVMKNSERRTSAKPAPPAASSPTVSAAPTASGAGAGSISLAGANAFTAFFPGPATGVSRGASMRDRARAGMPVTGVMPGSLAASQPQGLHQKFPTGVMPKPQRAPVTASAAAPASDPSAASPQPGAEGGDSKRQAFAAEPGLNAVLHFVHELAPPNPDDEVPIATKVRRRPPIAPLTATALLFRCLTRCCRDAHRTGSL